MVVAMRTRMAIDKSSAKLLISSNPRPSRPEPIQSLSSFDLSFFQFRSSHSIQFNHSSFSSLACCQQQKSNQSHQKANNSDLVSSFQDPLVGLSPLGPENQQKKSKSCKPSSSDSNRQFDPNLKTSLVPSQTRPRPIILPTHAFHTHRFIQKLENSGYQLGSAQQLLHFVDHSLRNSEKRWLLNGPSGGIVLKSYAEGQAYLYNAALGELRTEVRVKARNDGIVLKSASNGVQREIDNLKQKLKEDIGTLKNELQLELNGRKEETNDAQKKLELEIQELESKFMILVGEVRTDIETRKWVTTRRCVVAIASLALCVIIFTAFENNPPSTSSRSSSSNSNQSNQNQQRFKSEQNLRSVEELVGILPPTDEKDDSETDEPTLYFNPKELYYGKRIGEDS
ncbi:hypothetical protein O181_006497 [Austropuccinia psidii MF-1]|uniref:Uncharacterized protein n=1 Tax=Austropuccinia psidii MF-1 TaxID=1389203 RepID=A0A9Q3GHN1_9BASI|nr:hypothetical protein [Austropuccinia psidii MF-1]